METGVTELSGWTCRWKSFFFHRVAYYAHERFEVG